MKVESVNPGVERFKRGGEREGGYERVRWGRANQNKVGIEQKHMETYYLVIQLKYEIIF